MGLETAHCWRRELGWKQHTTSGWNGAVTTIQPVAGMVLETAYSRGPEWVWKQHKAGMGLEAAHSRWLEWGWNQHTAGGQNWPKNGILPVAEMGLETAHSRGSELGRKQHTACGWDGVGNGTQK